MRYIVIYLYEFFWRALITFDRDSIGPPFPPEDEARKRIATKGGCRAKRIC